MPAKSGSIPELPVGGHSTQFPPPPAREDRAVPPAEVPPRPLAEPPAPVAPLADDAAPATAAGLAAAAVFPAAFPGAGRAIAPPPVG